MVINSQAFRHIEANESVGVDVAIDQRCEPSPALDTLMPLLAWGAPADEGRVGCLLTGPFSAAATLPEYPAPVSPTPVAPTMHYRRLSLRPVHATPAHPPRCAVSLLQDASPLPQTVRRLPQSLPVAALLLQRLQ